MSIDLLGSEPLYRQIAAVITTRIEAGTYEPRRAIPSEAALYEEFGVSRNTVRGAIRLLNEQGLLVTVMGRGTFVVKRDDAPTAD
ncbi:GntR family transcriptional regulator [Streptosporangium sp. NBC_01810]|uniref:GntR family transcriptional regulator n=1 Tax=Streptosporangium sp. NBC_01810 TaxID=2975951 RepID=UPI002DDBC5C8|nr:GntR family transcriptional regulator [Streptosporangium sp. NBC_01810]WSA25397.1 GntR family transcriptional regulator [Streptosporangium sp. NBC_01810]